MMKERLLFRFLDRISFIYKAAGVDYEKMKKILEVKLLMDERRSKVALGDSKKNRKNNMMSMYFLYIFYGLFNAIVMFSGFELFYKMNILIGSAVFIITSTLIADFSAVLLDINEKNILSPRPVDPKVINAAKLTHILYYINSLVFSYSALSIAAGLYKYGIVFTLIYVIELLFLSGFLLFLTSIMYFIVLALFDGEKLKDVINYFQIALSIIIAVSYQFMGRLFSLSHVKTLVFTPKWYAVLIPSTWYAAPFELINGSSYRSYMLMYLITGIAVTICATALYFKVILPYFERNLQKLNNRYRKNREEGLRKKASVALSKIIAPKKEENIFYRFTENMIKNERSFKLKVYPSLALGVVLPVIMIMNTMDTSVSMSAGLSHIRAGSGYLFTYISVWSLSMVMTMISFSENYKGAWIYDVIPMDVNSAYKGAYKGFMAKTMVPAFLVVAVIMAFIFGIGVIPNMFLIFINLILVTIFVYGSMVKVPPFSKPKEGPANSDTGRSLGLFVVSAGLCGVCAVVHAFARHSMYTLAGNIVLSAVIVIILWKTLMKLTPKKAKAV